VVVDVPVLVKSLDSSSDWRKLVGGSDWGVDLGRGRVAGGLIEDILLGTKERDVSD
jgi:hypothetical protein